MKKLLLVPFLLTSLIGKEVEQKDLKSNQELKTMEEEVKKPKKFGSRPLELNISPKALLYSKKIEDLLFKGKYSDAMKEAHMAYGESLNRKKEDIELASSLTDIGNVYKATGDYKRAWKYHKKAFEILNKNSRDNELDAALLGLSIIDTMIMNDINKKLISDYSKATVNNIREYYDKISKKVGETKILEAKNYSFLNQTDKALVSIDEAIEIYYKTPGYNSVEYGFPFLEKAKIYQKTGNYLDSVLEINKFLKISELKLQIINKNHPVLAEAYYVKGVALAIEVKNKEAIKEFEKAIAIYQNINEKHRMIMTCYNAISLSYKHLGYYDQSIENAIKALNIAEKIAGKESKEKALILSNLGGIYYMAGKKPEAIYTLQDALNMNTKVFGKNYKNNKLIENNIKAISNEMAKEGQLQNSKK